MKSKLKNIASNPYAQSAFVGAMVTLLIYFVWDAPIMRYNIDVNRMEYTSFEEVLWFVDDFDGDGNSERIRCFKGMDVESLDIVNYDHLGNLKEHHHYPGYRWNCRYTPKIFDTNDDGIKELLFFDERNDSIFFNAVNLNDFTLQIDHHFFRKIEQHQDNYAAGSNFYHFGDFDANGTKELIFNFDAGFGLYPRGLFKMEFPSLKITPSPTDHMLLSFNYFSDLNSDGIPELLPRVSSPCNSYNAKKYADTCSYLCVFDYNLQPVFTPIKMSGNYSSVYCIPSFTTDSSFFALHWSRSDAQKPARLMLVNAHGRILKSKEWNNIPNPENTDFKLSVLNKKPYLIIRNVGRFKLNTRLSGLPNTEDLNQQLNEVNSLPVCFDFNTDGTDEFVLWDVHSNIKIINEKSDESFIFPSPIPIRCGINVYPYFENNTITQFAFASLGGLFFIKYEKNQFYFTLYLIYLLAFLGVSGTILTILYFQKHTIEKKWNTEKQLSELQFNAVKNQLNPHFMFNALNSIAYMINEGRNEEAYDFLTVNSRMIQQVMNDAKKVKRTLKGEIQFTKDYISIQKHRFKDRFDTDFIVHPDVDVNMEVPKMCIHTYVENAIKHGFRNTKSGGLLKVNVQPEVHGVLITISDNGMGRKAASEYKDSSGNGISIMNEFYQLFEKYHGYNIDFSITDVKPIGTNVKLTIRLLRPN